ncbi:uncharacterized protein LOC132202405 [Neocloeon triangulifer]|uniref:uncharacterized protein LOC132202405 n=1 Tax=Neocloeon triangulifer TaxID=2078957 RepID=UPI00286ED1B5|nr:uncharacterized protein LOC132202405 [Neocloeon triangulifer]XP_059485283.1 uncharacterized protein LOC132202405 [Neocloeon triangulifer]XP_059485284.1 uncharacterized protein LOC132202405 [Neocloeon triangulifer]
MTNMFGLYYIYVLDEHHMKSSTEDKVLKGLPEAPEGYDTCFPVNKYGSSNPLTASKFRCWEPRLQGMSAAVTSRSIVACQLGQQLHNHLASQQTLRGVLGDDEFAVCIRIMQLYTTKSTARSSAYNNHVYIQNFEEKVENLVTFLQSQMYEFPFLVQQLARQTLLPNLGEDSTLEKAVSGYVTVIFAQSPNQIAERPFDE